MNSITLLTPPMDEPAETNEEKLPGYYKHFQDLPPLSQREVDMIRMITTMSFDDYFARRMCEVSYTVQLFFAKARQYVEKYVCDIQELYKTHKYKTIHRRIFFGMSKHCHIVLMGNDWTGALETYQNALEYDPVMFARDPHMYYGLGLVYIHFKQWKLAIEAFSRLLYNYPTGRIALEAKVRLGMSYMEIEDYPRCLQMFYLAMHDPDESKFMPKYIIRYNNALANENYDELETAETEYKKLNEDIDMWLQNPVDMHIADHMRRVKAAVQRQLGWISYRRSYKDEANRNDHLTKAQECLLRAQEIDPLDGLSYYYLGRVYGESESSTFQAHEAFLNYRHSIDKAEQNADTWCSIGALYQRQNQPMDALQAFICSIELNKKHSPAWTDLGELYERNTQFADALECFKNALKNDPVAPEPLKARVQFLEKELGGQIPPRPANYVFPLEREIPPLADAHLQPIPLELRNRQDDAYMAREYNYDHAFWELWEDLKVNSFEPIENLEVYVPLPKPMEPLEKEVLDLLREHEHDLVKAEMEVLECLAANEAVFNAGILEEFIIPDVLREMPRVTGEMIERLREEGHLLESPRLFNYSFLPRIIYTVLPETFSLLAELNVSLDTSAQEIIAMAGRRTTVGMTHIPVFEEFCKLPEPPSAAKLPEVSEEDIAKALENGERHPLLRKTAILTVDSRKEAHCVELQRYLDNSTISCIRGLTSCLRLDLSLFSTKNIVDIAGTQEVEVRTQYQLPPEINCNHASEPAWKCISDVSFTTIEHYAVYQAESFKHTLKSEVEKMRKGGSMRGPSPKRAKGVKRAVSPPRNLKSIKFGTKIDLSDDTKWKTQIAELSKLPAFCRLIAGSNMLSHLGHQVIGMNTVLLDMKVPGARCTARQEPNFMASVNINVGPGEVEWFAVPYEYWNRIEKLCRKHGVDFVEGNYWPPIDDLLEAGIPVHRFTQKAGDMVYISGGSIHWCQATGWCNNISWNVAPLNGNQLNQTVISYEYNKVRKVRSLVPVQLLCWQVAKNVRFTNQLLYNTCKGVLIRSLAFLKMVNDFILSQKKTIKIYPRASGEQSHFCMACDSEVFSILFAKEINKKFTVFCVYCAKTVGLDDFIAMQQFSFQDLTEIFESMKYIPSNNNKINFTA